MYRQGLGDCFLLTLSAGGTDTHVLVDCGVVGRPDAAEAMRAVARDIEEATGGHLHLVVATHTHWDHVSGFADASEVFGRMHIDEVWLPSTENPGNEGGRAIRARRRALVTRLRAAAKRNPARNPLSKGVTGVLGLFGECAAEGGDAGAQASRDDEEAALAALRAASPRVRYLDTRDAPMQLPGGGAKAYVLGPRPPTSRPAAEAAQGAMDLSSSFFCAAERFLRMGDDGPDPEEQERLERNQPFDLSHRLVIGRNGEPPHAPPEAARFFTEQYYEKTLAWRAIDTDWLGMGRGLALTLESHTNDGSLVLAFELPGTGKVLLFPGDARVAPPAWSELRWSDADTPPAELLRRTVLYKVPHHCSQWATPAPALAAMESADLVALVSADAEAAKSLGWRLPHPPLMEELLRKTRGRVLLSRGSDPVVAPNPPRDGASTAEWRAFREAVTETPLYVEYSFAG
jgi:hypothetical protein